MRSLHLEKNGLRGLAIAESFDQNNSQSILAGTVMRRDFYIDGFVFGFTTLKGDDATQRIKDMYDDLKRPDVNYVLISGMIISMYNIVDIKSLSEYFDVPVMGISYFPSSGLESSIRRHFPDSFELKIRNYKNLGPREKITLHTSHDVYVRFEGCTISQTKTLLDGLTISGSVPEPIRVSQLLAKTLLRNQSSF